MKPSQQTAGPGQARLTSGHLKRRTTLTETWRTRARGVCTVPTTLGLQHMGFQKLQSKNDFLRFLFSAVVRVVPDISVITLSSFSGLGTLTSSH